MMAVNITTEPTFVAGRPRPLFEWKYGSSTPIRSWDVSRDGERFLVTKRAEESDPEPRTHLNLVLNWHEELQARVPTSR